MLVRVNYGINNGRAVEFPYHIGKGLIDAGRGVKVEPGEDRGDAIATAEPARVHRDPVTPRARGGRR